MTEIVRPYCHAQAKGAGFCAGQALLLCHRLFALKLSAALVGELQGNRRVRRLAAIALRAMVHPNAATDRAMADMIRGVFQQFLSGQGLAFFADNAELSRLDLLMSFASRCPPHCIFSIRFYGFRYGYGDCVNVEIEN